MVQQQLQQPHAGPLQVVHTHSLLPLDNTVQHTSLQPQLPHAGDAPLQVHAHSLLLQRALRVWHTRPGGLAGRERDVAQAKVARPRAPSGSVL